jgi:hypothetical protein
MYILIRTIALHILGIRMWKNPEKISNSLAFKIKTQEVENFTHNLYASDSEGLQNSSGVKVALCAVLVISNDPHPIYNKSNTNPYISKVRVREMGDTWVR